MDLKITIAEIRHREYVEALFVILKWRNNCLSYLINTTALNIK